MTGESKEKKETGMAATEEPSAISIFEKVMEQVRAGLVASVIAEALLFPLDIVKLQQQVNGGSALEVFRRVLQQKGATGFYKGLLGRLIQTITSNVGFFVWQTIAVQTVAQPGKKLGTGPSLLVNMLAQQINRLITTPVDVVASVNQNDPKAKGFISTFIHLAQTGGRQALWRGLPVSMILSFNPALMFTLVDKLSAVLRTFRKVAPASSLGVKDMFWISGISKAIATVATYPLIRAKSVQQAKETGLGLMATLTQIYRSEGNAGLYAGVWMLSYKTVLFNSLMMALKQQIANMESKWKATTAKKQLALQEKQEDQKPKQELGGWRKQVVLAASQELPWTIAARGGQVVYTDGSWSLLTDAQEQLLQQCRERGDYLLVGVHSDQGHEEFVGTKPLECFSTRASRLREHGMVDAVVEGAPWNADEKWLKEMGITTVVTGYPLSQRRQQSPPRGGQ